MEKVNALPTEVFISDAESCCASEEFARKLSACRPFASVEEMLCQANHAWDTVSEGQKWRALAAHPLIGRAALEKKFRISGAAKAHNGDEVQKCTHWAAEEQAGVHGSPSSVLDDIERYNDLYFEKHGFLFLIFASDKTVFEILESLKVCLGHTTEEEVVIWNEEETKIMNLRLKKLYGLR